MEDIINITVYPTPYGVAGPQGTQGATGPQGATGTQGATGPQGSQGPAGDIGPEGPQGMQGEPGSQGIPGIQGNPGETGPQGNTGATGAQGATGNTGDVYRSTSTSTVNLSTLSPGNTLSITVPQNLSYSKVQTVLVANSLSNYFTANIISYAGATLSLSVVGTTGSGSYSEWDVNLAGSVGQAGPQGPQGNTGSAGATGATGAIPTDYVVSFNGLTGGVTGVSDINGLVNSVSIGVGGGLGINTVGNSITISNSGVLGIIQGTGIVVSGSSTLPTIANSGVLAVNGFTGGITFSVGSGLGLSQSNNQVLIQNNGILGLCAGSGIVLNGLTYYPEIQNTGIIGINGLTGGITFAAGENIGITIAGNVITISAAGSCGGGSSYGVSSFNGFTGAVEGVSSVYAGSGINLSSATGSVTIANTGVRSAVGTANQITVTPPGGTGDLLLSLPSFLTGINNISPNVNSNFNIVANYSSPSRTTQINVGDTSVDINRSLSLTGTASISVGGTYSGRIVRSFNGSTGDVVGISSISGITSGGIGITGSTGISISRSGQTLTIATRITTYPTASANLYLGMYGSTSGTQNPVVDSNLYYNPSINTLTSVDRFVISVPDASGAALTSKIDITDPGSGGGIDLYSANGTVRAIPSGVVGPGSISKLVLVTYDLSENEYSATIQPTTDYTANRVFTLPNMDGTFAFTQNTVSSFNGLTGAVTGVTTGTANNFIALQTFSAGISSLGGTFGSEIIVKSIVIGSTGTNYYLNDRGMTLISVGQNNLSLGRNSLTQVLSGNSNVAVGVNCLQDIATGSFNIAIGANALQVGISPTSNIAIGANALNVFDQGSSNIALGDNSLSTLYNDVHNIGVGLSTLQNLQYGCYNTAIGGIAGSKRGTGANLITATGGVFIGYDSRASGNLRTNEIVIGTNAVGLGSNQAVIGATTQTAATIYGTLNIPGGLSCAGATFSSSISAPNIITGINGLTGGITLAAGANIGITISGNVITISGGSGSSSVSGVTDGSAIIWNLRPLGNTTGDLIAFSGNSWAVTPRDYVTTPSLWTTLPTTSGTYPPYKYADANDPANGNIRIDGTCGPGAALGEFLPISLFNYSGGNGLTLNSGTWWLHYTVYTDATGGNPGIFKGFYSGLTLVNTTRHIKPHTDNSGDAFGYAIKIRGSTLLGYNGRGGPYGNTGCTADPNQNPLGSGNPCGSGSGVSSWTVCTTPVRGFTYNNCYIADGCGTVICP